MFMLTCVTAIVEDSYHVKGSAILVMICFITNYVPFCVSKINNKIAL